MLRSILSAAALAFLAASPALASDNVLRGYDPACTGHEFDATGPQADEHGDWIMGRLDAQQATSIDKVRLFVVHQPDTDSGCDASGDFELIVFPASAATPPRAAPAEAQRVHVDPADPAGTCADETCRVIEVDLETPIELEKGKKLWVAAQAYRHADGNRSCFAKCTGPASALANQWSSSEDPSAWSWQPLRHTVLWVEAIDE